MSVVVLLASCGSSDPDANHFPWQEQPTSAPSPVPVPTSDGDPTAEPDPNGTSQQVNIDLIVAALVEQGFRLRGIHDTDRATGIEDGVHFTERSVIEETSYREIDPGLYESLQVIDGTLMPDGSVDVTHVLSEVVSTDTEWIETVDEIEHWRLDLDGTRHPTDPWWVLPGFPDESVLASCPDHVITMKEIDELGQQRMTIRPRDPASGEPRHLDFRGLGVGEYASFLGGVTDIECDAESALVFSDTAFQSLPEGKDPEGFWRGRPAVIELTTSVDPYALEDVQLSAVGSKGLLIGAVLDEGGEIWSLNAGPDDAPVLRLPGSRHFDWMQLEATDDALVVVLRDSVPTQPASRAKAYVVHVDLVTSDATIYTRTISAPSYEITTVVSLGEDLMVVNLLDFGMDPVSLAIDVRTDTVVRIGDGFGSLSEVSGSVIGFRRESDATATPQGDWMMRMEFVIGSWNRE